MYRFERYRYAISGFNSMESWPLYHIFNHPKHSVPDAKTQGKHDSWSTQWGFFEFPGKDSHCQETKYNAYDFGDRHLFTRPLKPFPHLKQGNFLDVTSTVSPVFGLRPVSALSLG